MPLSSVPTALSSCSRFFAVDIDLRDEFLKFSLRLSILPFDLFGFTFRFISFVNDALTNTTIRTSVLRFHVLLNVISLVSFSRHRLYSISDWLLLSAFCLGNLLSFQFLNYSALQL